MKTIINIFIIISMVILSAPVWADTIPLKATWTAPTTNADGTPLTDLDHYNLYRTDGSRVKINSSNIATTFGTSGNPYLFSTTATGAEGTVITLTFVVTAVDINGNESVDSNVASYQYTMPKTIPAGPSSLIIQHQ